ncbi:MAG: MBL fold metallo-hydrolase [Bacteroidetes bacterium]|nr:MBL fold metallo-hydrolase [Bacteroidota bacterium]
MLIHHIESGPVETIGYLVADEASREVLIIDVPMQSRERMKRWISDHAFTAVGIILTHGHFDHVGDVAALARDLSVPVHIHPLDAPMLEQPASLFPDLARLVEGMRADALLEAGEVLECGRLRLRIIHAPGHTPGHVVLYEMREGVLFSGDVLFHSSVGRTDLPGGDYETLMQSITKKLFTLPEDTVVYPGHGESTTIGFERAHNPYVLEYLDHY